MTGARRRRPGPQRAPHRLTVNFSEAEFVAVSRAASAPGQGVSLARYVAEAALTMAGALEVRPALSAPTRLALAELTRIAAVLGRVGNNLNQLARELNSTGAQPAGTFEEFDRTTLALQRLREALERNTPP